MKQEESARVHAISSAQGCADLGRFLPTVVQVRFASALAGRRWQVLPGWRPRFGELEARRLNEKRLQLLARSRVFQA